ncbi:hypothetical protein [Cerasicoccus maritimus]|uniref:hypothetical protein n=1 Tax=Cerasicoccus maritimus TaxID=490089 RepID=UPI002852B7AE|nr:hypothetical protein [Cerasicoccus maritimus]
MKIISVFIVLLLCSHVHADFQVGVLSTESTASKSLVKIKARNTFDQGIKGARAWIFLLDGEGHVIGQQAQWIIGGDKQSLSPTAEKRANATLMPEKAAEFSMVVPHTAANAGVPAQTKITFSRIILEDGTLVNPQKSVKPLEDKPVKP